MTDSPQQEPDKKPFAIGKSNPKGGSCCNKPHGCTRRDGGCLFPLHPWKRAVLDGDTTVRCQATSIAGRCALKNGHSGTHDPIAPPPARPFGQLRDALYEQHPESRERVAEKVNDLITSGEASPDVSR